MEGMTKRESGYYWVRVSSHWYDAYWDESEWSIRGSLLNYTDQDFKEIKPY